jgi:hypothetical protein
MGKRQARSPWRLVLANFLVLVILNAIDSLDQGAFDEPYPTMIDMKIMI